MNCTIEGTVLSPRENSTSKYACDTQSTAFQRELFDISFSEKQITALYFILVISTLFYQKFNFWYIF